MTRVEKVTTAIKIIDGNTLKKTVLYFVSQIIVQ